MKVDLYQIILDKSSKYMKKWVDNKLISEKTDSVLMKKLVGCSFKMKKELGSIKKSMIE